MEFIRFILLAIRNALIIIGVLFIAISTSLAGDDIDFYIGAIALSLGLAFFKSVYDEEK